VDRSKWTTRKRRRSESRDDLEIVPGTPAERMSMMWQLALDAWALAGHVDEPTFRRDAVRVVRGRR
jgi:hypothetical protein